MSFVCFCLVFCLIFPAIDTREELEKLREIEEELKRRKIETQERINDVEMMLVSADGGNVFLNRINSTWREIDIINNIIANLEILLLSRNPIAAIDLTQNLPLRQLNIDQEGVGRKIKQIDLSQNTQLQTLQLIHNELTTLDLSANTKLEYLVGRNNSKLTSVEFPVFENIVHFFNFSNCDLRTVDLSNNSKIARIMLTDNPNLTSVDVSGTFQFANHLYGAVLTVFNNPSLTSLNVANTPEMTRLEANDSAISTLDVSGHPKLDVVFAYDCPNLISINAQGAGALRALRAYWTPGMNGKEKGARESVNINGCIRLGPTDAQAGDGKGDSQLYLYNQKLSSLDLSGISANYPFPYNTSRMRIQNNNMSELILPNSAAVTTTFLNNWRSVGNATNDQYHLEGNNFGIGNLGIVKAE